MRIPLPLFSKTTHRRSISVLAAVSIASSFFARAETDAPKWIPAWISAQQVVEPRNLPPEPGFTKPVTLREVVQMGRATKELRVVLANTFGNGPVVIGAASVGRSGGKDIASDFQALTFSGRPDVAIPAGATATSDPVSLDVDAFSLLAITMQVDSAPSDITGHPGSRTTSYLAPHVSVTAPTFPGSASHLERWYFLRAIEVPAEPDVRTLVVIGDSIADGLGSTVNGQDRWPDQLAHRLATAQPDIVVLNQGVGGNCLVRGGLGPAGIDRFERDVLSLPDVHWVIIHEGVNDLGGGTSAADIIAALKKMIAQAHEHGIRVYGGTVMPFGGSFYRRPGAESERQTLNKWIRESGEFDAVIDFDAITRQSGQPDRLGSAFDRGDHLHPSPEGYRRMAASIDLDLFKE